MAKADGAQAGKTTNTEPSGAKTSAKKSGARASGAKPRFDAKFLDDMRRKLLKERAKYLHSAEEYQAEA
ncbi:MAG: hypothetical protein F4Y13_01030, partial [Acidimicrobiaceae bacterium]|nr:hypothetical protein [Acidimicrobiaceae bacterium]